jgi:FkbM family methyltransferase
MRSTLGLIRSLVIYWRPGRQRGLRRLYRPFVGPGDLVFDVGAHLGDRTAAFSSLGASVVALEPQPKLLLWLRRLVGRRPGVTIRPEAVGRTPGAAQLAVSEATPTLSTLSNEWKDRIPLDNATFQHVRWERSIEVAVTTLDLLIARHGEPRFCKIDVEGHEAEVLAGLTRPLEALSVEFVAGSLDVALACVDRLERLSAYRYNVVPGERRDFVLPEWTGADEIMSWFRDGADGVSSGDLYARRADVHTERSTQGSQG